MNSLKNSLENLVSVSQDIGLPFVQLLRPGQSREKILHSIAPLNLLPLPQLIEFYEFCDGVDSDGRWTSEVELYQGYWILPLHEALQEYELLQRTDDRGYVQKSWFPLLKCDRDRYVVDCARAMDNEPCVFSCMPEYEPTLEYCSIKSMVDTFADCYQEDAIVVLDKKIVDYNYKKIVVISVRHNPGVEFWTKRLEVNP